MKPSTFRRGLLASLLAIGGSLSANALAANVGSLPTAVAKTNVGQCIDINVADTFGSTDYQLLSKGLSTTKGDVNIKSLANGGTVTYCASGKTGTGYVTLRVNDNTNFSNTNDYLRARIYVAISEQGVNTKKVLADTFTGPNVLVDNKITIDLCPDESATKSLTDACHLLSRNSDIKLTKVAHVKGGNNDYEVTDLSGTAFSFTPNSPGHFELGYIAKDGNNAIVTGVVNINAYRAMQDADIVVSDGGIYTAPLSQDNAVDEIQSKSEFNGDKELNTVVMNRFNAQQSCQKQGFTLPTQTQFEVLQDATSDVQQSNGWPIAQPYWVQADTSRSINLGSHTVNNSSNPADDVNYVTCYAGSDSLSDIAVSATDDSDAQQVSVKLTDHDGNPIAGKTVYFYGNTDEETQSPEAITFAQSTAVTDAEGIAETTAYAAAASAFTLYANYASITKKSNAASDTSTKILVIEPVFNTLFVDQQVTLKASTIAENGDVQIIDGSFIDWASSNSDIAKIDNSGKVTALTAGVANITASYDDNGTVLTADADVMVSDRDQLTVTPSVDIEVGEKTALSASVTLTGGSVVDDAQSFTWSSDNKQIAKVNKNGKVTGVSLGSTTVLVEYNDNGTPLSATSIINVIDENALVLTELAVIPLRPTADIGEKVTFTAIASFSDGTEADVTTEVTWSSLDKNIATINQKGIATGKAYGQAAIKAEYTLNSVTKFAESQLNIQKGAPLILSVAISPSLAQIEVGASETLRATATFDDATESSIATDFTWLSSNDSIVSVNSLGKIQGITTGSAIITATYTDAEDTSKTGESTITVVNANPSPLSVVITPNLATIVEGENRALTAFVSLNDGSNTTDVSRLEWITNDASIATVTAGLVQAKAKGITLVIGRYTANGITKSDSSVIIVESAIATPLSVVISPSTLTLDIGDSDYISAIVTLSDGSTITNINKLTWKTSNDNVILSNSGRVHAQTVGSTTITGSYTVDGITKSDYVIVTVKNSDLDRVTLSKSSLNFEYDTAPQDLNATAYFKNGSTITDDSKFTWKSSNHHATVSSTGLVDSVSSGTATITAAFTSDGTTKSASALVTINVNRVSSVSISPASATIEIGGTKSLTAVVTFDDGEQITDESKLTWISNQVNVASVNYKGVVTGNAAGSAVIYGKYALNGATESGASVITVNAEEVVLSSVQVTLRSGFTATSGEADSSDRTYYDAIAYYSDGTSKNIRQNANTTWSSKDTSIATVVNNHNSYSGYIAPRSKVGTTLIRAAYSEGGINRVGSKEFTTTAAPVTITGLVVGVSNYTTSAEINSADRGIYTATLTYSNGSTKVVTKSANTNWSSNKTSIATVNNNHNIYAGRVAPQGEKGTATITAKYTDNGKTYSDSKDFTVTVTKAIAPDAPVIERAYDNYVVPTYPVGYTGSGDIYNGGSTDDHTPGFLGYGHLGDTIKIYSGGKVVGTTWGHNQWYLLNTSYLSLGTHTFYATATNDDTGLESAPSNTWTITIR